MPKERQISPKQASLLRKEIQTVVAQHKTASMDLCRVVYETSYSVVLIAGYSLPVWQRWGYSSWAEFVGFELGLHPTTAYVYRRVWQRFFVDLAGAWDSKLLLPVSKMRILAADRGLNRRNVSARLAQAASMTCTKLAAEVYGVEELHHFSASVNNSELRAIRGAIERYRDAFGEEDMPRGQVIARIAKEWSAFHTNVAKAHTTSKSRMANAVAAS